MATQSQLPIYACVEAKTPLVMYVVIRELTPAFSRQTPEYLPNIHELAWELHQVTHYGELRFLYGTSSLTEIHQLRRWTCLHRLPALGFELPE